MGAESRQPKTKLSTTIVTSLFLLSLATGIYFWKTSGQLARQNNLNELRADSLLSAKLRLEGDIRSLESQLESNADNNTSLDNRITDLHQLLDQRDHEIQSLRRDKARRERSTQLHRRKADTSTTRTDSLEKQLEAVSDKVDWLSENNSLLVEQNNDLQKQISHLNNTLSTTVSRTTLTGDAFLVEAKKANQQETAKAKKVKTLTVSLHIPAELHLEGSQEVYLSLTNEQRAAIIPPLRTTTVSLATTNDVIPVHATQRINFDQNPQRISFIVRPGTTLKPGKYRASVFTKDRYLGSVDFHFRDSFLFF